MELGFTKTLINYVCPELAEGFFCKIKKRFAPSEAQDSTRTVNQAEVSWRTPASQQQLNLSSHWVQTLLRVAALPGRQMKFSSCTW